MWSEEHGYPKEEAREDLHGNLYGYLMWAAFVLYLGDALLR